MATTREIQRRIKSVKNIGKVTRAMEAVSASRMRRAQAAVLASRPYATKSAQVLARLRAQPGAGTILHPLLQEHPRGRPAVLLITPDRGLTGGLVLNIIRFAMREVEALGDDVGWVAIGKKGRDFLTRTGKDLQAEFTDVEDTPRVTEITPVARLLLDSFLGDEFSAVHIIYADFKGVMQQEPTMRRLLPIAVTEEVDVPPADFAFEPDPEALLDEVLPRLLELQVYQAVLEAQASEHSARMVAMRNATEAANDLVDDLTLSFNKLRQQDITSEILDIAGGAEALRKATS